MKFEGGSPIKGKKIDVAFIGSCTNGRLSDFQEVAQYVKGHRVADGVQAIIVPGSQVVAKIAEGLGPRQDLHRSWLRMARRGLLHVLGDEP